MKKGRLTTKKNTYFRIRSIEADIKREAGKEASEGRGRGEKQPHYSLPVRGIGKRDKTGG